MPNKPISILALVLVLGSAAAWHWWPHLAPTPAPPPAVAMPPPVEAAPEMSNPLPATTATDAKALPALTDSDAPFAAAALALPGAADLKRFLQPESLIRRLVATIDNLPRHRLAVESRPLAATSGSLGVTGDDQRAMLNAANSERYAPLIAALGAVDMHAVSELYRQYYPLFQRAYQDLGYPNGYFNDRLVAVIDHLLATPEINGPLALVRPKVFWEFADPELESRSSGQKLILRFGAENGAVVRKKLRELRALVAANRANQ